MRRRNGLNPLRRTYQVYTELAVDYSLCHECGACVAVCPPDALFLSHHLTVNQETCTGCDRCVKYCPVQALQLVPQPGNGKVDES